MTTEPKRVRKPFEGEKGLGDIQVLTPDANGVLKYTPKNYNLLIKNLANYGRSLFRLVKIFRRSVMKDQHIVVNVSPTETYELTKKEVDAAMTRYFELVEHIKALQRQIMKKKKKPSDPASFKGIHAPIYAGEALRTFFGHQEAFGPYNVAAYFQSGTLTPDNYLMAQLPLASQGYMLRNTATMLFYDFARYQQIQNKDDGSVSDVSTNPYIQEAFNGQISSTYYVDKAMGTKVLTENLPPEIPPLNTFQLLTKNYPPGTTNKKGKDGSFNPARMQNYFLQNIGTYNFYNKSALEANPDRFKAELDYINNEQVRQTMLQEHSIVENVKEQWKQALAPSRAARNEEKKEADKAKRKANKAAGKK